MIIHIQKRFLSLCTIIYLSNALYAGNTDNTRSLVLYNDTHNTLAGGIFQQDLTGKAQLTGHLKFLKPGWQVDFTIPSIHPFKQRILLVTEYGSRAEVDDREMDEPIIPRITERILGIQDAKQKLSKKDLAHLLSKGAKVHIGRTGDKLFGKKRRSYEIRSTTKGYTIKPLVY